MPIANRRWRSSAGKNRQSVLWKAPMGPLAAHPLLQTAVQRKAIMLGHPAKKHPTIPPRRGMSRPQRISESARRANTRAVRHTVAAGAIDSHEYIYLGSDLERRVPCPKPGCMISLELVERYDREELVIKMTTAYDDSRNKTSCIVKNGFYNHATYCTEVQCAATCPPEWSLIPSRRSGLYLEQLGV